MPRVFLIAIALLFVFSCQKDNEQRSYSSDIAMSSSIGLKETWNTTAVAIDFAKNYFLNEPFKVIPSVAKVQLIDSSFADGDGISLSIHFPDVYSGAEKGIRCLDGFFRMGSLNIRVNKPWGQAASVLEVETDSFYASGNNAELRVASGNLSLIRTAGSSLVWRSEMQVGADSCSVSMNVNFITDMKRYSCYGIAEGRSIINGINYKGLTAKDLIFDWNTSCQNKLIEGSLDINAAELNESIYLDFNPYNDENCDEQARWRQGQTEDLFYFY